MVVSPDEELAIDVVVAVVRDCRTMADVTIDVDVPVSDCVDVVAVERTVARPPVDGVDVDAVGSDVRALAAPVDRGEVDADEALAVRVTAIIPVLIDEDDSRRSDVVLVVESVPSVDGAGTPGLGA